MLRINDVAVPVLPNGAFLAFLPLPSRSESAYRLEVVRGRDTVRAVQRITLPPPRLVLTESGPLLVDSASLQPRTPQVWSVGDRVRVSVRAPRSASVVVRFANGGETQLHNVAGLMDAVPNVEAFRLPVPDANLFAAEVPVVAFEGAGATLIVRRGGDSVALRVPRISTVKDVTDGKDSRNAKGARDEKDLDVGEGRWAIVGAAATTLPDTDRVVIARPVPGGTYKWFLMPGTIVRQTARVGENARIRLDSGLDVWVEAAELRGLPAGFVPPRRVTANARVVASGGDWSEVFIPMSARPAYAVEEEDRAIVVTLYDTQANTDIVNYASADASVERVVWEQVASDRARYTIQLRHAPYGYLVRWESGALAIRVRRPPVIDPAHPLTGLTIAVDAGHPPGGSTGPTGLYEPVATLAIALRVQAYLETRGARVVMTRTAPGAIALNDRPVIARRANAHAFVSIHLNALPDGVNPFISHGTGAYYFNTHSVALARELQRGMVRRIGLRDLGTNYDNLAVLRPTWMPAVLCEGAFLMIPEQEAALRTAEFQDRYALGVVEGIEAYFKGLAHGER
ncbi:MAG: N-acetylmuramoyl-L-alanine amidase [Gemmatimonadaceae bacterium]